jgi:lactate dehydrogenase-like 2-hydroxyacid dehydrogenase
MIINTSRGALINTEDAINGLSGKSIYLRDWCVEQEEFVLSRLVWKHHSGWSFIEAQQLS